MLQGILEGPLRMNWGRIPGNWKQLAEWERKASDAWFSDDQVEFD